VNHFAQQFGVAVVGNHRLHFRSEAGTGRENELKKLSHGQPMSHPFP
jgi:hypothetical protein